MFGVDFSELMIIFLVALIVIGPERLPKVARTLGFLWGRAQRYVNGVKADIARDMAIDEYRQLTEKIQEEARSAELAATQITQGINRQVQEINDTVERPAQNLMQSNVTSAPSNPSAQQQAELELHSPEQPLKPPVN
jgi:sec-independent protein translocase protein TatB